MRIFYRRPLALACVLLALWMLTSQWISFWRKLGCIGILLLCFLVCLLWRRARRLTPLLCIGCSVLALVTSILCFDLHYPRAQRWEGEEVTLRGVVVERIYSKAYASRFRIETEDVDGEEVSFLAVLDAEFAASVQVGDRVEATVTSRPFRTDGDYEEEQYYLSQGCLTVFVCKKPEDCRTLESGIAALRVRLSQWNTRLSYRLVTAMGREEGGLAAALLLGNRSFLSEATQLHFRRTGVSHLLALSGLHVSILIAFLDALLRLFRMPKLGRAIAIPVAAVGYLCLTGFALSTVRAVCMACAIYLAFFFRARYDSFTSLSCALAGILLVSPYSVLDLSLWLSFLAAGAIIVFSPAVAAWLERVRGRWTLPRWTFSVFQSLVTALFVGVIANLALLLVMAAVFGEISLLSVPVTMLMSIPVTLLLPLILLTLLFPVTAPLSGGIASLILACARECSEWEGILLPVNDGYTLLCFALLSLVLVLWAVTQIPHRYPMLLLSFLLILGVGCSLAVTHLSTRDVAVHCASDGSGEVVLFSRQGHAVAVDLSDGTAGDASLLLAAAKEGRCTDLDDLILTRYYSRSPYLFLSLCNEISLGTLRLPPPMNERERGIAYRLEQEAARLGVEVRYDTEHLGIPDLTVLCCLHTPLAEEGSRVLFSVQANGKVFTCMNGGLLEGELGEIARAYLWSSHTVLFSQRAKGSESIAMHRELERLILSDPSMKSRFLTLPENVSHHDLSAPLRFFLK